MKTRSGFTLIELIVVMAILAILAALISGSFLNSLKKGRDAQRKGDLEQVKVALETFYEDKGYYPAESNLNTKWGSKLCETSGCTNEKVYMQKLPQDPKSDYNYYYVTTTGQEYYLYACIENSQDEGNGVDQDGYTTGCGCTTCKFRVSSSNAP